MCIVVKFFFVRFSCFHWMTAVQIFTFISDTPFAPAISAEPWFYLCLLVFMKLKSMLMLMLMWVLLLYSVLLPLLLWKHGDLHAELTSIYINIYIVYMLERMCIYFVDKNFFRLKSACLSYSHHVIIIIGDYFLGCYN